MLGQLANVLPDLVRGLATERDLKHLVRSQEEATGFPKLVAEGLEGDVLHVLVLEDVDRRVRLDGIPHFLDQALFPLPLLLGDRRQRHFSLSLATRHLSPSPSLSFALSFPTLPSSLFSSLSLPPALCHHQGNQSLQKVCCHRGNRNGTFLGGRVES